MLPAAWRVAARARRGCAEHLEAPVGEHAAGHAVHRADELGDERRRRAVVDLLGRAELLEAPAVHHADAVGDRQRLGLVVGDEQRRDAEPLLDAADLDAQLVAHARVERRQRLVEQQHARLDRERSGERDALLLAAGELVGVVAGVVGEADELEHLLGARAPLPAAAILRIRSPNSTLRRASMLGNRL